MFIDFRVTAQAGLRALTALTMQKSKLARQNHSTKSIYGGFLRHNIMKVLNRCDFRYMNAFNLYLKSRVQLNNYVGRSPY